METFPPLKQLVFLLTDLLVGQHRCTRFDLVDVGCPRRAQDLEDDGRALKVTTAPSIAYQLEDILESEGEESFHLCVQFLNRVKNFPFEFRSPEWERLVARFSIPEELAVKLNVNVCVNDEPVETEIEVVPRTRRKKTQVERDLEDAIAELDQALAEVE